MSKNKADECLTALKNLTVVNPVNVNVILEHFGFIGIGEKVVFLESIMGVDASSWPSKQQQLKALLDYFCNEYEFPEDVPSRLRKDSVAQQILNQVMQQTEPEVRKSTSQADEIIDMLSDLNENEIASIFNGVKAMHQKYEKSPDEIEYESVCQQLGIACVSAESSSTLKALWAAGVQYGRRTHS